jgi:AraC family transcriptional regulator
MVTKGAVPMARDQAGRKVAGAGLAPWQIERTVRLLLADLGVELPVGELARRCGLSRSHYAKAFKVSMGTPPHRWLVGQRVRRAREMLERTDESIAEIALSCGFADQSHLTRIFHAIVGTSPAAWRRQCKAGAIRSPLPDRRASRQLCSGADVRGPE